jgi:electron transfer flavoprotein alpha subunit
VNSSQALHLKNMETILCLTHIEPDGSLGRPALEALGWAVALRAALPGSSLLAGYVGASAAPAANSIASCGADAHLAVTGTEFSHSRYATDAAACEALVRAAKATIVIAPATSRFARCLPGVAQRLGGRADTHVTEIETSDGRIAAHRWYYRQRMEAVFSRDQRPWFLLTDPGSGSSWQGAPGAATVQDVSVAVTEPLMRTVVTGFRTPAADAQTIRPEASLLLVAGAGWTKKQADGQAHTTEAEKLILSFLKQTRASLGSSKSLVDQSGEGQAVLPFLSHLNQIGQTGSTPRHPKGLSTCCHGEEPHTVGWRFIKERRAISLDPNCGWARGKADVLYVADAFQVMGKVNELLAASS